MTLPARDAEGALAHYAMAGAGPGDADAAGAADAHDASAIGYAGVAEYSVAGGIVVVALGGRIVSAIDTVANSQSS